MHPKASYTDESFGLKAILLLKAEEVVVVVLELFEGEPVGEELGVFGGELQGASDEAEFLDAYAVEAFAVQGAEVG